MEHNNILLISDNNGISKILSKKLVLLRKHDTITVVSSNEFPQNTESIPSVIFLVENEDRELTIQNLKLIKEYYKNVSVILATLKQDNDFILEMYDLGINDFISLDTSPAELLIKTINAIKLTNLSASALQDKDLLKIAQIISKDSGFYTENCANELMLNALDEPSATKSSFMILACDELDRGIYKADELIDAIHKSVRCTDLVIELKSGKFYLYLRNTDEEGATLVFNKIKNQLGRSFRIKAGIAKVIGRSFRDLEQMASVSFTDAMLGATDYVIYKEKQETPIDEWLLEPEDNKKDFKLFKQIFLKKLDNVITPVFYRFQTSYENILKDTKIEQYSHETQCIFHLKNKNQTSRLTIVYPGFAKVMIYETHSGWDSPENKEIFIPLNQLTERALSEILEKFIQDFKSCIYE